MLLITWRSCHPAGSIGVPPSEEFERESKTPRVDSPQNAAVAKVSVAAVITFALSAPQATACARRKMITYTRVRQVDAWWRRDREVTTASWRLTKDEVIRRAAYRE